MKKYHINDVLLVLAVVLYVIIVLLVAFPPKHVRSHCTVLDIAYKVDPCS